MAKKKSLSKLIASLEDSNGTAQTVDAANPSSSLKNEIETPKTDAVQTGEHQETDDEVQAGMKDYTAIDNESKRQGEALHKKQERLNEAEASCEAYVTILRDSLRNRQGLDAPTANVMRQDLISQYPKFFKPMTVALEEISNESEAIGYSSSSKELALTKAAEKEGSGALTKLKAAAKAAWAKFWEWCKKRWADLKSMWAKLKKLFTKEKAKTQFLLGCAKSSNPKSIKLDVEGAEGTKTAAAIKALGHDKQAAKAVEKEEKEEPKLVPLPDVINVTEGGYLVSVENDWEGIGRWEDSQLRSISQGWASSTVTLINALHKLLPLANTEYGVDEIKDVIEKGLIKKLSVAVSSGNKILEVDKGGWKLVAGPDGGKEGTEYGMLSRKEAWAMLDRVMLTYENVEELEDVKAKLEKAVSELQGAVDGKVVLPAARTAVTEYLTSVLNSDWAKLTEHGMRVCKARRAIADAMIAAHIAAEGK